MDTSYVVIDNTQPSEVSVRRILILALCPVAAAVVALSGGASAAPPPLPLDMTAAFDTDCTQERGAEIVTGSCQGGLFHESFIADAFLTGTVTLRKQTFKMGDSALLAKNVANGAGQVVPAPKQSGYRYLHVLMARITGEPGKQGGTAVITYSDNSKVKVPLVSYGWGSTGQTLAWTGPIQGALHTPAGTSTSNLFVEELALNPKKAVSSVTLPSYDGLRVFAMTLSTTTSAQSSGPVFN